MKLRLKPMEKINLAKITKIAGPRPPAAGGAWHWAARVFPQIREKVKLAELARVEAGAWSTALRCIFTEKTQF